MTDYSHKQVDKVYNAKSDGEREAAYDDWAEQYEADLWSYGFRLPADAAAAFARFVEPNSGPVLDAGCGTGLQVEALHLTGYGPFTGIDLSEGMMAVAAKKGIYLELRQMTLGEPLDFADDSFANTLSVGTITPGHAPAHSFDELIRVTRPGGLLIFSLRVDDKQDPVYPTAVAGHEAAGRIQKIFQSEPHASMPLAEPDVIHCMFVYEVL